MSLVATTIPLYARRGVAAAGWLRRTTCFASGDRQRVLVFFSRRRCLNAPACEYLVTAADRVRYRSVSRRAPGTCDDSLNPPPGSLAVSIPIVDPPRARCLVTSWGSTRRSPPRGNVINLRGINRSFLRARSWRGC